jgi:hypothetical protein
MPRLTIHTLITEDLGYCCEWFFFSRFRRSALIADRLGVTQRAVQIHRAEARHSACENCPNCLRRKITASGELRKRPLRSDS